MTASSLPDVLAPAAQSRFPHRARALLGLFAVPGASLDALKSGLIDWQRERSAQAQQPPELLRVGVRIAGTEEDLQESVGSYFGETIAPLDAFVTVDHRQSTNRAWRNSTRSWRGWGVSVIGCPASSTAGALSRWPAW